MSTQTVDRDFELRNAKIQFYLSIERLLKLAEVAKRDHERLMGLIANCNDSQSAGDSDA